MPRKQDGRTEMISFAGVIIDNIENHFDASGVEIAHHSLEFGHFRTRLGIARVPARRREKTDGLVTPIVLISSRSTKYFSSRCVMHRQQLNRGYAQIF